MKRWIFVAMSLSLSSAQAGETPVVKPPTEVKKDAPAEEPAAPAVANPEDQPPQGKHMRTFSSAVNVLRQGERVEAVFRNGEIYSLPRGARQHKIFKALSESEQTGAAVSVTVNERTGVIEHVKGGGGDGNKDMKK